MPTWKGRVEGFLEGVLPATLTCRVGGEVILVEAQGFPLSSEVGWPRLGGVAPAASPNARLLASPPPREHQQCAWWVPTSPQGYGRDGRGWVALCLGSGPCLT